MYGTDKNQEDYFRQIRNQVFEEQVQRKVNDLLDDLPSDMAKEVTLRYVTHVFAQTLDGVADRILKRLN